MVPLHLDPDSETLWTFRWDERHRDLPRKFRAMFTAYANVGGLRALRHFDSIMLADDDLLPVGCTISNMFECFHGTGARVGHPALTRDSPHAFPHSLQAQDWHVPYSAVPFCELMCPMFTRAALFDYLPYFGETVHGWGLEQLIAHREHSAGRPIVRLDATPMRHTRPLGGSYNHLVAMAEAREFLKRHGIPEPEHMQ